MKARTEDLARSGCVAYDPDMKQDYHRRIESSQKALDKTIEASIESAVANLPTKKREQLASEMEVGMTADVVRGTAPLTTIVETHNA